MAEHSGGDVVIQDKHDLSKTDPKKSAYYDVKVEDVTRFTLYGTSHTISVDLKDGSFLIDGLKVWLHPSDFPLFDFRLIYKRRHWEDVVISPTNFKPVGSRMHYILGWYATGEDGQNYMKIMELE